MRHVHALHLHSSMRKPDDCLCVQCATVQDRSRFYVAEWWVCLSAACAQTTNVPTTRTDVHMKTVSICLCSQDGTTFHVSAECCSSRALQSSPKQQEIIDLTATTSGAASDPGTMGDHAAGAPAAPADNQATLAAFQLLRVPKLGASANRCTVVSCR